MRLGVSPKKLPVHNKNANGPHLIIDFLTLVNNSLKFPLTSPATKLKKYKNIIYIYQVYHYKVKGINICGIITALI